MRSNRVGIPADLKATNLAKGKFAYRRKGKVLIMKYNDKKVVYMLSTMNNAGTTPTRKRNRQGQAVHRLKANHEYNQYMGGVDKNDSMVSTHSALRKSIKWYKKLGLHYIEESLQNAYVVYRLYSTSGMCHYTFLKEVVRCLLVAAECAEVTQRRAAGGQDRLLGKHFLELIPATVQKTSPTKRCVVCTANGERRESRYQCKVCATKPALCVHPCDEIYHTKAKF